VPPVSEGFDRESLGDRAYRAIKNMIITRQLEPGAAVPESVLAKTLGISRSPIKAALTRLQQDGLIVGEAWKVPHVAPLDAKYVDNVYQVRRSLEALCARQSIDLLPDEAIARFGQQLDSAGEQLKAGSLSEIREAHYSFNEMIAHYSDNELLQTLVAGLQDHLARIRQAGPEDDAVWLTKQYGFLSDKLDAMKKRDADALVAAVTAHLDAFRDRVFAAFDEAAPTATSTG
jgi:DNA-binding GntR family transcriptional regulator